MSAAAPTADAAVPVKKSKKKLIIMLLIGLVVVLSAGGGGLFYMKKKAAAQAEAEAEAGGEDGATAAKGHSAAKPDLKHPPTFLALDPFVVNLADKDVDRYAQVGITLEVEDAKFADQMKGYMPALRNSVLMLLAHKTSRELLERAGKELLAVEIKREALRTVGLDVDEPEPAPEPEPEAEEGKDASADGKPRAKAKAKKKAAPPSPIHNVHFSTFIIQ
ncbi:MAG: flagellar basal body-associated FliL family protein [Pseudorhodobacter sp.]|nr:flagellar basal body-associated FliL family protein [Rhizobacter sp.]